MKCYLCESSEFLKVDGTIRDDPNLSAIKCCSCGLITLNNFAHINQSFYKDSKMMENTFKKDYSAWSKTNMEDKKRRIESFKGEITNKNVLDFGCGTGDFLKHAREYASSISAVEVDAGLRDRLSSIKGLTLFSSLGEINKKQKFDVIFLFHVLEHIAEPISLLKTLGNHLSEDGKIIIEVPNADDALLSLYNCDEYKNFYYWKCHLFYYTSASLQKVCEKSGFSLDYIKQIQRYPLSNHLMWLKEGRPGGHYIFNYLDSDILRKEYESRLASLGNVTHL